jgi:16S rRNA C967 or C1407 C5-methylase (RsmB/RsmF family)
MGRKWKRNKKNKHTGGGKPRDADNKKESDPSKHGKDSNPYKMTSGGNHKMEAFYAYQGIHDYFMDPETGDLVKCSSYEEKEEERKRWLSSLKQILPASFRIGNDVDETLRKRLEHELDEYVGKKMEIVVLPKGGERRITELDLKPETIMIEPVKRIPYIPHGFQMGVDRGTIRRNAGLKPFFEWLKIQTAAGFVTRQETVSMIPPVVLDPKPHHKVLDMCAAPGSKTSQLLEIVNLPANPNDPEPTGFVIANDNDAKRAYMLVHQLRRINSPACFISTCDAQFFPLLPSEEHPTEGLFDRVLCDVPCSGDGTSRKNPGVWKNWNQLNAYGLHALQLAIALKGARLTRVGGYLCYSTCSMNPIENEAVVAELLRASEGCLELVDRKKELPGLRSRPGMTTWKILSEDKSKRKVKNMIKKHNEKMQARRKEWEEKNNKEQNGDGTEEQKPGEGEAEAKKDEAAPGEATDQNAETPEVDGPLRVPVHATFAPKSMDDEELKKMIALSGLTEYASVEEMPANLRRRIRQTCFPPTAEEAANFKLERCMRILPQDMDTGGFFVTLLKKVAPMNSRARRRFEKLEEELQEEKNEEKDDDEEPKLKKAKTDPSDDADVSMEEDSETPKASNVEASEPEKSNGEEPTADELVGTEKDSADVSMEEDSETPKASDVEASEPEKSNSVEPTADELVGTEKDSKNVARGHLKKNFLRDKDGNKHETLGRDDFIPFPGDLFAPLKEFYGLDSDSFEEKKYMIRACGDSKVLYFMSNSVKDLIEKGIQQRVTVVNSGLKSFVRTNKLCEVEFRIAQEGVHFVAPHMTKRKLSASMDDFKKCLNSGTIQIKDLSESFTEQVRAIKLGSFVVQLEGYENDYIKKLVLVMWRCRSDTISALVTQTEIDGMKSKLRAVTGEAEPIAEPTDAETVEAEPADAETVEAEPAEAKPVESST